MRFMILIVAVVVSESQARGQDAARPVSDNSPERLAVITAEGSTPPNALFELAAVAIDGEPIPPSTCICAPPGSVIDAEILISGWGETVDIVNFYDAWVDGSASSRSGQRGRVLPVGWDAPATFASCDSDADCAPDLFCEFRKCVGPEHDVRSGAFIDRERTDFLFFGREISALAPGRGGSLEYLYFAWTNERDGPLDLGLRYYAGTLLLVVSDDARGRFAYRFAPDSFDPGRVALVKLGGLGVWDIYVPSEVHHLQIETDECDCNGNGVVDCNEPDSDDDGVIDDCDSCSESDLSRTITLGVCDNVIINRLADNGCMMADFVDRCEQDARNHGEFVSCITRLARDWAREGLISRKQHNDLTRCAARAMSGKSGTTRGPR